MHSLKKYLILNVTNWRRAESRKFRQKKIDNYFWFRILYRAEGISLKFSMSQTIATGWTMFLIR